MNSGERQYILDLKNLSISFGDRHVVRNASLRLERGEVFALVGESGSGKTLLGRSLLGLLPPAATSAAERLVLDGDDLSKAPQSRWRSVRGSKVGLIFQEPMVSLNPSLPIGTQLAEAMRLHTKLSLPKIREMACELLAKVRVPDPAAALHRFPHQFSGGLRQRIMLASVLLPRPKLLIADEPTTALDVIVQKQVLDVMVALTRELGTTVLLITHDLGLVAKYADRVAVMRNGEILESGKVDTILTAPKHEYTRNLLASVSRVFEGPHSKSNAPALLQLSNVRVSYSSTGSSFLGSRTGPIEALKGISLEIKKGETLAIVGESGSGKSSLGRAVLGLNRISSGTIRFDDLLLGPETRRGTRALGGQAQMIFQDPYSSLNPRMRALQAVCEGLLQDRSLSSAARTERGMTALQEVGLAGYESRYPHQLSGGQRQRLCIARALIVRPKLLIADEPIAALDATIQSQILDLLSDLKRAHEFTCIFISHDLAAVRRIADRVAVLCRGELVECGSTEALFETPRHNYTKQLLEARPLLLREENGNYRLV